MTWAKYGVTWNPFGTPSVPAYHLSPVTGSDSHVAT